jgi:DNA-binding PadR family transcriptional regulator
MALVAHGLLGLLEGSPRHGYDLRQAYERRFPAVRPLRSGQVYSTLSRLQRDGQVDALGDSPGRGPDRKLFAITEVGVAVFDRWLASPEPGDPYMQDALFMKVVLAVSSGRSAQALLDAQRERHLEAMRDATRAKETAELSETLRLDFALFHLEADLRWIDHTVARLGRLGRELHQ